LNLILALELI